MSERTQDRMARASYGKARGASPSAARAVLFASLLGVGCGLLGPETARADEPWLLAADGVGAVSLNEPQTRLFGPGASLAVGVYRPLTPYLLGAARLRLGVLTDGDPPPRPNQLDPGLGGWSALTLAMRLRFAGLGADDGSRATGAYVEVAMGAALTGARVRFATELGVGWLFRIGPIDVGPTVRYAQLVEGEDALEPSDARLLLLGVEVVLFDPRGHIARPELETPRVPDRDHDGIPDRIDACPEEPEDHDDFEDADGCPDLDNDGDRVRDVDDHCPLVPEDRDGFEDLDGCPDPDNDHDDILDGVDRCPNDAEIVNGVDDEDGCPDEGLIALVDDRIVLEETVLFDFERSRVKSSARPVLHAIVRLVLMHPEWIRVRIEGHADARGDTAFNQDLSERRATNVREALVALGVPAGIIDSAGFGATRPRDAGNTEEAYQRNRRVEFVVLARRGASTPAAAPPASSGASSVPAAPATPATPAAPTAPVTHAAPEDAVVPAPGGTL